MKRILYVSTNEIQLLDLPKKLDEMGYDVYSANLNVGAERFNLDECKRVEKVVSDLKPDYIITYDFVESVSRAALYSDIPYISWVYDSPQKELYSKDAHNLCNYIFVFDKKQQARLKSLGIRNVFHTTLAIHSEKIMRDLEELNGDHNKEYDISFVGQLYKYDNVFEMVEKAPNAIKEDYYKAMDQCFMRWDGSASIYDSLPERALSYIENCDNKIVNQVYPYMTKEFFYESAVVGRLLANRERIYILNKLSKDYDVNLFTFDRDTSQLDDSVIIRNGAKYDHEVSKIYNKSKINLNITLHSIETGASQRVFDVMAAGGFLLSNYQLELAELFEEGKEIELFRSEEELFDKVKYYLKHEDERAFIARAGQEKVLKRHDFSVKLERIFKLVDDVECKRKNSYIEEQREYVIAKTDELIRSDVTTGYEEFANFINEPKFDPMRDIVDELEVLTGISKVISLDPEWWKKKNVHSVSKLMDIYTSIKRVAINLEQCSYDDINNAVIEYDNMIFWAWVIAFVTEKPEDSICFVADLIKNNNVIKALELLQSGLLYLGDNKCILLKISEYLLALGMYREALDSLRRIKTKDESIVMLIQELCSFIENQ